MENEISLKEYRSNLIFPVLWLILMTTIEAIGVVPPRWGDYFFMLYFGGFFVYFVFVKKQFNVKVFLSDMKTAVFWKYTLICIVLLVMAYYSHSKISSLLKPRLYGHMIPFLKLPFSLVV